MTNQSIIKHFKIIKLKYQASYCKNDKVSKLASHLFWDHISLHVVNVSKYSYTVKEYFYTRLFSILFSLPNKIIKWFNTKAINKRKQKAY